MHFISNFVYYAIALIHTFIPIGRGTTTNDNNTLFLLSPYIIVHTQNANRINMPVRLLS